MDAVLRATALYIILLILIRLAGRRTLANLTNFDFILLLIIGEASQQALLGDDLSLTNAFLVVGVLITLNVAFGFFKERWPLFAKVMDGVPMIIVEDGRPLEERMRRARISIDDVQHAARSAQGLERLDQVKYAILEVSGGITIIPK
jgi:uncharacterized membrane protein YcaP (DUF421 family)